MAVPCICRYNFPLNSNTLCFSTRFINSPRMSGLGFSGYLYPSGVDLMKCNALWTPSCGMFVYRDDTSIEASLQCVGSFVAS